MRIVTHCDLCHRGFTKDDLEDPKGITRLEAADKSEGYQERRPWRVVGFGNGKADLVVHTVCMGEFGEWSIMDKKDFHCD